MFSTFPSLFLSTFIYLLLVIGSNATYAATLPNSQALPQAPVLVSIKPLAFIYAALRPRNADTVAVLLPSDRDMHHYALGMNELKQLQQADTVFWLGASSEPYIGQLQGRLDIHQQWLALAEGSAHSWLDMGKIPQMTQAMAGKLAERHPEEARDINLNALQFLQQLDERIKFWQNRLQAQANQPFLLGHDALLLLTAQLGLKQGLLYLASNDHGHKQAGMFELLDLQQRIAHSEISCAMQEPEVDFAALEKRYSALTVVKLDLLGGNIDISANAYLQFIDSLASQMLQCLQARSGAKTP